MVRSHYLDELLYLPIVDFTTAELQEVDALAALVSDEVPSFIDTISLHPIFDRGNWQKATSHHLANYPLMNGGKGFWVVN